MPRADGKGPHLAAALVLCLLVLPAVPSSAGTQAAPSHAYRTGQAAISASVERKKVLAAIGSRTGDARTLAKVREKIMLLEGRKLRLAAALCDRAEHDEGSAGSDIAFSLVTALVMLS